MVVAHAVGAARASAIAALLWACTFDPAVQVPDPGSSSVTDEADATVVDAASADAVVADGPASSNAPEAAVVSFSGGSFDAAGDDVVGFRFTIGSSKVAVTHLGFFDRNDNGLVEAHKVAIYDIITEEPVVSADVPGGTSAVLEGGFRYVAVNKTELAAGSTYVALGYRANGGGDHIAFDVSELTTSAWMTFDTEVAQNETEGLIFVNTPFGGQSNGWFGPNFKAALAD